MPKLKKQPKNSCYFYMQERKIELEAQGHKFLGGIRDVFTACGPEWSKMTKEDKAKYEAMAKKYKEEEKDNKSNKFTASGESYAQVEERMRISKASEEKKAKLIHDLVFNGNVKERVFILIKTLHSVEQILQKGKMYWPAEIALVAFTLQGGLKKFLWKLVDTEKAPLGYASSAKESSEECGIPLPGSEEFSEKDRNYKLIFEDIQEFIEKTLIEYAYDGVEDYVVFCKKHEIEPAKDSLLWLLEHIHGENESKSDKRNFLENLQFCELGQLMVQLGVYGNGINPKHPSQLAQMQLIHTANNILDIGSFDYRSEITCSHHNKGEASQKMNFCCKNVVLRRMYLMFKEFLPQYGIEEKMRHDIARLPKEPPRQINHPTNQYSSEAGNSPPRSSSNSWSSKTLPTSAYKDESWPQEPSSSKIDTFSGSRLRNDAWSKSTVLSKDDPADWPTPTNAKVEEETRLWSSSQLRQNPSEAVGSDVANNDGLHKVESAVSSSQEPRSKTKGAWDFRAPGNDRPSSSRDRETKDSPNLDVSNSYRKRRRDSNDDTNWGSHSSQFVRRSKTELTHEYSSKSSENYSGASSTGAEDAYSTPWRAHVQPKDVKDKELNFNDDNFPSLQSPMGWGARKRDDTQDDDEGNKWVVGLGRGRGKRK